MCHHLVHLNISLQVMWWIVATAFPPLVNGFTKVLQEVRVNISTSVYNNGRVDNILENVKEVTMGFTSPKKKSSHTKSKANISTQELLTSTWLVAYSFRYCGQQTPITSLHFPRQPLLETCYLSWGSPFFQGKCEVSSLLNEKKKEKEKEFQRVF